MAAGLVGSLDWTGFCSVLGAAAVFAFEVAGCRVLEAVDEVALLEFVLKVELVGVLDVEAVVVERVLEEALEVEVGLLLFALLVVEAPRAGLLGMVGEGNGEAVVVLDVGRVRVLPDAAGDFTEDLFSLGELKPDFMGDLGGWPVLIAAGLGLESSVFAGFISFFSSSAFVTIVSRGF